MSSDSENESWIQHVEEADKEEDDELEATRPKTRQARTSALSPGHVSPPVQHRLTRRRRTESRQAKGLLGPSLSTPGLQAGSAPFSSSRVRLVASHPAF